MWHVSLRNTTGKSVDSEAIASTSKPLDIQNIGHELLCHLTSSTCYRRVLERHSVPVITCLSATIYTLHAHTARFK